MQKFLALIATLFLTISGANGQGINTVMQTINLGRFLADIPKDANIVGQGYFYVNNIEIQKAPYTELETSINKEISEINKPKGYYQVSKIMDGAKKGSKIIVRRAKEYKVFGRELGYELSGHFWVNGYLYHLKSLASFDKLAPASEKMLSVISSAKPLNDKEIPIIPGFCIKGAFFPGVPPYDHYESAEIFFRLKKYTDIAIKISINMATDMSDGGLIKRSDKKPFPAELSEIAKKIRTLRKGKHNVGTMEGEEILEAFPADGGYFTHLFTWESDGKSGDVYAPGIVVVLNSGENQEGGDAKPLISDKEAISLFDEIVNSIRVRPIK